MNQSKVTLFSKPNCQYCDRAKVILDYVGVKYQKYDVTANQRNADASVYFSGVTTVPQIFIGDYHINGAEDLEQLEKSGRLEQLVKMDRESLSFDTLSDEELHQGAADFTLCNYLLKSDGSRDKDDESLIILRFCQELFGFWPNTYAYLYNWSEAYKLFYHCHLLSATENIKQVMGLKNLSAIGYSTSHAHGCSYCQVHTVGISNKGEDYQNMAEMLKQSRQGKTVENNPFNQFETALARLAADATLNQVENNFAEHIETIAKNINIAPEIDVDRSIEATSLFAASFGFLNVFNELTGLEIEGDMARQVGEDAGIEGGRHGVGSSNPDNLNYKISQANLSIEEIAARYDSAIADLDLYVEQEFGFFPTWIHQWSQLTRKRYTYFYSELMGNREHSLISAELKHLMARVSAIARGHDYLAAVEGYMAYNVAADKELAIKRISQCFIAATDREDTSDIFNPKEQAALKLAWLSAQIPLTTPYRFIKIVIELYQPQELIHLIVVCSVASMVQRFVAISQPEIETEVAQFYTQHFIETDVLRLRYPLPLELEVIH
ncbi:MAG: glutaredoxin domain-containing protein [Cyanobacteria bacterium J06621_12]